MRKWLPLLLAGLVLLSGCGRGQVTDGGDLFRTDSTSAEMTDAAERQTTAPAVQTQTAAEPSETAPASATIAPTTQTTAAPTMPTTPAANGTYDFTAQYIRAGGVPEDVKYPQTACFADRTALDAYLTKQASPFRTADTTLATAVQRYDDAWFASHTLLAVVLEEGSGSVRHTVMRVEKTAPHRGTVGIKRDVPEVGTCDMAYWYILIELPAGVFGAEDTIEVVMQ